MPRLVSRNPSQREVRKSAPAATVEAAAPTTLPATAKAPSLIKPMSEPQAVPSPPSEQLEKATLSAPLKASSPSSPSTSAAEKPVAVKPQPATSASSAPAATATKSMSSDQPAPEAALVPMQGKSTVAAAPIARWSRNFLSGNTPLIPAHDNLDHVSSSYPAEFPLLLSTTRLLLFPVSGSGGRIAVHDRRARGRMPLVGDVKTLEVGTELVDIALDPVDVDGKLEIATAGKDGKIKIWSVPQAGLTESVHEPTRVVDAPGVDKVAKLAFSPAVKHLLAVASSDFGDGVVRVVDTQSGATLVKEKISEQGVRRATRPPLMQLPD